MVIYIITLEGGIIATLMIIGITILGVLISKLGASFYEKIFANYDFK
jgi:hypothetical protein